MARVNVDRRAMTGRSYRSAILATRTILSMRASVDTDLIDWTWVGW
jgi:hypothetical protein